MLLIKSRLITVILILGIIFLSITKAFSWDIIDCIFKDKFFEKLLSNPELNSPNINYSFLPHIENKSFFGSVDDLSICRNKYVRKYIYMYLTDGRQYLSSAFVRSERYINIIEDEFIKNPDIPKDISLLPLLESAFNPYAVSKSKAVGLWQFIRGTSKELHLKTNSWVDERRDIEKSTAAAITHLRHLYSMFQSWEIALAAYNGGAGYIKKAMYKTRSNTISELLEKKALKKETSEYIYRFAALLVIYKNQDLFDIENESQAIETENIEIEFPVKLSRVAEIADVPIEILKMYNPELNKDITPPYEKSYSLRMPKDSIDKLEQRKSELYVINYKTLKKHIVKKGECIGIIAKLYNTDARKIVFLNGLKNADYIRPGSELYIPI